MALPWVEDVPLILEPEPNNPHDPDAIKVMFEYASGKRYHLGYIPNPKLEGTDARAGTATRIKDIFDGSEEVWAIAEEVTGGEDGQSYGCNIAIWRGGG